MNMEINPSEYKNSHCRRCYVQCPFIEGIADQ